MPSKTSVYTQQIKDQLHMLHNPFADSTQQPKIPDGKVNSSLGFQTATIQELQNAEGRTQVDILLYAGTNSMYIVDNSAQATLGTRTYYVPNLTGSNSMDWSSYVDASTAATNVQTDNYALWRCVSVGLRLKLLNASEEDDGWWEAVRVNPSLSSGDWYATTTENSTDRATNGTLAPRSLTTVYRTQELVNNPTYSTGLLRDLHRVQFELHGRKDYHDFVSRADAHDVTPNDLAAVDVATNYDAIYEIGRDDIHELINNWVDPAYDMIYIRLHCRANDSGNNELNGSRFHVHGISNQEIYFETDERENRFHTKTHTIGSSHMSLHLQGRRQMRNAATLIM